jgi:hypothetical protein
MAGPCWNLRSHSQETNWSFDLVRMRTLSPLSAVSEDASVIAMARQGRGLYALFFDRRDRK